MKNFDPILYYLFFLFTIDFFRKEKTKVSREKFLLFIKIEGLIKTPGICAAEFLFASKNK